MMMPFFVLADNAHCDIHCRRYGVALKQELDAHVLPRRACEHVPLSAPYSRARELRQ